MLDSYIIQCDYMEGDYDLLFRVFVAEDAEGVLDEIGAISEEVNPAIQPFESDAECWKEVFKEALKQNKILGFEFLGYVSGVLYA